MIHPEIAKALVEERREELTRHTAESRQARRAGSSWLSRRLPHWHVSWTRTVLFAGGPGTAGSSNPDRRGKRGSSLVIIISAYR
ncbi:MAG TPA: hypothetical protein VIY52_15710 [Streptosporangiaceae bacterium]